MALYYIPAHRLGSEVAERFLEFSKTPARIMYGRSREELSAEGVPMCFPDMHEKAEKYEEARVSVSKHLAALVQADRGEDGKFAPDVVFYVV